jgi:hypothetical protein
MPAMMIPLYCPSCGKELCVRDELLGSLVYCPVCETIFRALMGMEPPLTPYSLAPEPPPIRRSGEWRGTAPEAQTYSGAPLEGTGPWSPRQIQFSGPYDLVRHRGSTILGLGIGGLVISGCPVAGWIVGGMATRMGADDIDQMNRGNMDPAGRGMTSAGRICGIIAVILSTLSSLAGIFFLVMYLIHTI